MNKDMNLDTILNGRRYIHSYC